MNLFKVLRKFVFTPNDRSGAQLNNLTQQAHCNLSAHNEATELSPICPPRLPMELSKTMGNCVDTFQIWYHRLIYISPFSVSVDEEVQKQKEKTDRQTYMGKHMEEHGKTTEKRYKKGSSCPQTSQDK